MEMLSSKKLKHIRNNLYKCIEKLPKKATCTYFPQAHSTLNITFIHLTKLQLGTTLAHRHFYLAMFCIIRKNIYMSIQRKCPLNLMSLFGSIFYSF